MPRQRRRAVGERVPPPSGINRPSFDRADLDEQRLRHRVDVAEVGVFEAERTFERVVACEVAGGGKGLSRFGSALRGLWVAWSGRLATGESERCGQKQRKREER